MIKDKAFNVKNDFEAEENEDKVQRKCTFCLKIMCPRSHITSAMEGFPTNDVVMWS
jgi:hypothetical protein